MANLENAKTFVNRLAGDTALREKVITENTSIEAVLVLAQTLGYQFTGAELKEALESYILENGGSASASLSDGQLDGIAGGVALFTSSFLSDFVKTVESVVNGGSDGTAAGLRKPLF